MNRTAIKEMTERMFRRQQPGLSAMQAGHRTQHWRKIMNRKARTLLGLALVLGLAGCASPTPHLDESFGDAVRAARLAQTVHPDAGLNADPVNGLDGMAANESMKHYDESFKTPPPVTNVINIGGVIGGAGAQ
jgi:hypothetical protein